MKLSPFQPKRTDVSISYSTFMSIYQKMRKILNISFDRNKFAVIEDDSGISISLRDNVSSTVPEDFAIKSVSGVTMTLYGGSIVIGSKEYIANETTITFSAYDSYIGYEFSYSSLSLSIQNFGTTMTYDQGYIRKPLYYVLKNSTTNQVSVKRIKHVDLYPANFGTY